MKSCGRGNPSVPLVYSFARCLFLLLALIGSLLIVSGCARFSKAGRNTSGSGGILKKKVAVLLFENQVPLVSKETLDRFNHQFTENLAKNNPGIMLLTPGEKTYPEGLTRLPQLPSGLVNNLSVAATGRKHGLNAIITGTLLSLKTGEDPPGIWWFSTARSYVEPLVSVEVLDTETGAKILDERLSQKFTIQEEELQSLRTKDAHASQALVKPFQQMAETAAKLVSEALYRQAWQSFIIAVTAADKVILSADESTGLVPGDVLNVYDSSGIINGFGGQQFFVPGLKIGELRITAVYPNRSEAVVISGTDIKEGSSVKLR